MVNVEKKKLKIPATVAKKCLSQILGIPLPGKKGWAELATIFPHEKFSQRREHKVFLRQYVWKYCNEKVSHYYNPFLNKTQKHEIKNLLVDKG